MISGRGRAVQFLYYEEEPADHQAMNGINGLCVDMAAPLDTPEMAAQHQHHLSTEFTME